MLNQLLLLKKLSDIFFLVVSISALVMPLHKNVFLKVLYHSKTMLKSSINSGGLAQPTRTQNTLGSHHEYTYSMYS